MSYRKASCSHFAVATIILAFSVCFSPFPVAMGIAPSGFAQVPSQIVDVQQLGKSWEAVVDARLNTSFSLSNSIDANEFFEFRQGPGGATFHLKTEGAEILYGFNTKYSFRLTRTGGAWGISEVDLKQRKSGRIDAATVRNTSKFLKAEGRLLSAIVNGVLRRGVLVEATGQLNSTGNRFWCDLDNFQIVANEPDVVRDINVRKITTKWTSQQGFHCAGTFWCLPENDWFPIKTVIQFGETTTITRELSVTLRKVGSLPTIHTEEFDYHTTSDIARVPADAVWKFDANFPASFPDSQFRLSAYGLPEPPGILWGNTARWIWVSVIGICFIAMGIFLQKRRMGLHGRQNNYGN